MTTVLVFVFYMPSVDVVKSELCKFLLLNLLSYVKVANDIEIFLMFCHFFFSFDVVFSGLLTALGMCSWFSSLK